MAGRQAGKVVVPVVVVLCYNQISASSLGPWLPRHLAQWYVEKGDLCERDTKRTKITKITTNLKINKHMRERWLDGWMEGRKDECECNIWQRRSVGGGGGFPSSTFSVHSTAGTCWRDLSTSRSVAPDLLFFDILPKYAAVLFQFSSRQGQGSSKAGNRKSWKANQLKPGQLARPPDGTDDHRCLLEYLSKYLLS